MSNRQGQTTLFFAAQVGRAPVVRYLLEHGADVDVVDEAGRTPLDAARGNGGGRGGDGSEEVVALLESAGSEGN